MEFLGVKNTSIMQPLDQGIIPVKKRLYRKRFLEEVMFMLEDETDESEGTREQHTLQNSRNYTLKSEIFSFAAASKTAKNQTLKNGWEKTFK
jgi:hypothetical protein